MSFLFHHLNQSLLGDIGLHVSFSSVFIQITQTAAFKGTNLAVPRLQFLMDASDMGLQSIRAVKHLITQRTLFCPLPGSVNLPYVTYQVIWVPELPLTFLTRHLLL